MSWSSLTTSLNIEVSSPGSGVFIPASSQAPLPKMLPSCSSPSPILIIRICCPHAPDLHQAFAPRCPQEDARPRAGVAPWERFVSKTGTRAGGWAGRPFPTAVRFLPLPASSAQHQAGRGAQGHLGLGERALGLVPRSTSRAARPPLAHPRRSQWRSPPPLALASGRRGRGGVKLPQGLPRAGREGAPVGEAQPVVRSPAQGRGGEGAAEGRGCGERGRSAESGREPQPQPQRGWRAGAHGGGTGWAGCGFFAAGPKSEWKSAGGRLRRGGPGT